MVYQLHCIILVVISVLYAADKNTAWRNVNKSMRGGIEV